MRGLFLSFSHLSPILSVSLLVLSTPLLWAQRTASLEEIPVQLLDTPAQFATTSEAQTRLHLTYGGLPLSFEQNQVQTEARMRFFPHLTGHYRLPVNTNAVLNQSTRTAELWGKEKYLIGRAPSKWPTFAPTYGMVQYRKIRRADDLEYYGHHIPWAGSIILRVFQQAKAHPHVTSVLKVLKPRF